MGGFFEVGPRNAGVREDLGSPFGAKFNGDLGLEHLYVGVDVVEVRVLVAGFDVDELDGPRRVVRGVADLHGLAEEGGGIAVDDDGGVGFLLVDGFADGEVVVVVC